MAARYLLRRSGYPKYGWWQKFYPEETWGLEYASVDLDQASTIDAVPGSTEESSGPDLLDLESAEEFPENETEDDVGPDEIDLAASVDPQDDDQVDQSAT